MLTGQPDLDNLFFTFTSWAILVCVMLTVEADQHKLQRYRKREGQGSSQSDNTGVSTTLEMEESWLGQPLPPGKERRGEGPCSFREHTLEHWGVQ